MKLGLLVVDDFLNDPWTIRRQALRGEFGPQEYRGHSYSGISRDHSLAPWPLIEGALGNPITPVLSFFRLALEDDQPTTFIHADTGVEGATHAGVLYLTDPGIPHFQGTAFWSHRELGWDRLPSSPEIAIQGHSPDEAFFERLNREGQEEAFWHLDSMISGKFNRFIIYPVELFHSRFPRQMFGEGKEEGRLIWCSFFRASTPEDSREVPPQTDKDSPRGVGGVQRSLQTFSDRGPRSRDPQAFLGQPKRASAPGESFPAPRAGEDRFRSHLP